MEQLRMSMELQKPIIVETPCAPYRLRAYRTGDEAAWEAIVWAVFQAKVAFGELAKDPAFRPERVFFVTDGANCPVATATLWEVPEEYPSGMAVLHMVGSLPGHRGHALGRIVSAAAMARAEAEGFSAIALKTDDARVPAVKTYLKLGFLPRPVDEGQAARWAGILQKLGREDIIARLPALLWRG